MDFYQALKSGMTAEEITEGFNKELEEAVNRFEEEREAKCRKAVEEEQKVKRAEALDAARHKAAAEVIEYLRVLFEVEGVKITDFFYSDSETLTNLFYHLLEESEKDVYDKLSLANALEAFAKDRLSQKKDPSKEPHTETDNDEDDDAILFNFLSSLF